MHPLGGCSDSADPTCCRFSSAPRQPCRQARGGLQDVADAGRGWGTCACRCWATSCHGCPHSSRPPNQDRPSLKTAFLSRWTKGPVEVAGGNVLPAGDVRESFEQQRPITALTSLYSDTTLITDQYAPTAVRAPRSPLRKPRSGGVFSWARHTRLRAILSNRVREPHAVPGPGGCAGGS